MNAAGSWRQVAATVTVLAGLFTYAIWYRAPAAHIAISVPFVVLLYTVLFSIGDERINAWARWPDAGARNMAQFVAMLAAVYFAYQVVAGLSPFRAIDLATPLVLAAPAVFCLAMRARPVTAVDFVLLLLCVVPFLFANFIPGSRLPPLGHGFDSVYRLLSMIAIVLALSIRGLGVVRFRLDWNMRHTLLALGSGLALYGFLLLVSATTDTLRPFPDYRDPDHWLAATIAIAGSKFLHTALYEELIFRGVLQGLLERMLAANGGARKTLIRTAVAAAGIFVLVGIYRQSAWAVLALGIVWAMVLGALAWIERHPAQAAVVVSWLVASMLFGLVHLSKDTLVAAMALLAGLLYGWVYLRTRSVIYAALAHGMVNSGPVLLGYQFLRVAPAGAG